MKLRNNMLKKCFISNLNSFKKNKKKFSRKIRYFHRNKKISKRVCSSTYK